jgi:N-acetylneuraminic acid mutarotase
LDGIFYDFWRYDPEMNELKQIADFEGVRRHSAVSFVLQGEAYVGSGIKPGEGVELNDFWEYDPQRNEWQSVAELPVYASSGAVTISF